MTDTKKRALVILAPGAEEMEATIVVDVLRRAGVEVTLAGLDGVAAVTCSRGVRILPDAALTAAGSDFDAVVLPGGAEGAERLAGSELVGQVLRAHWERGAIVAAICAGPTALAQHELALGSAITNHPSVSAQLQGRYQLRDDAVVKSGQLITSQGPGTSFAFALTLVAQLCGQGVAAKVQAPMMLPPS